MAKEQGFKFFKDFDPNKVKYPAVLIIETDISDNGVVGPFNNADELKHYIEKHNLIEDRDSYAVSYLHPPQ